MIDDSGGRSNEAIQVYARGVNPFVSVSYSNHGNNGGQQSGGITVGGVQSAKLPYPIMKDGAFRPPILLQEDLVPLSRIPRGRTSAGSNAGFTDFSRKLREVGDASDTKEVKTTTIKGNIRPTAVYHIYRSAQKPFDVKYVIKRSNQLRKNGVQLRELSCNYTPLRSGRKSLDHEHISRLAKECQAVAAKRSTQDVLTNSINQAIINANS
jgi:hypothetical protein